MLFKTKYAGLCVLGAEIFYPPSQKATGVNPWMNARWVPSVALAKEGTLRPSPSEVGYGRRRSEGSARRSVWRGATAVRPWGSTSFVSATDSYLPAKLWICTTAFSN